MGTLREYFETDFSNAVRVKVTLTLEEEVHDGIVIYDLVGHSAFIAWYLTGCDREYDFFSKFLEGLDYGRTQLNLGSGITLPAAKTFPGALRIEKKKELGLKYKLFGDPEWRSAQEIQASRRVFLYTESELTDAEVSRLQEAAEAMGHKLQVRGGNYVASQSQFEHPLAFISHDSRDKSAVARPIAENLRRLLCPVWYDEFSLQVGDSLRERIEAGIKQCKKCVLVLSPNFFSNRGWTKKEFDSVFTREILEESKLVLPVWHGVTNKEVYDYSPSLADVVGLDWESLGEEEVCRRLYRVITE